MALTLNITLESLARSFALQYSTVRAVLTAVWDTAEEAPAGGTAGWLRLDHTTQPFVTAAVDGESGGAELAVLELDIAHEGDKVVTASASLGSGGAVVTAEAALDIARIGLSSLTAAGGTVGDTAAVTVTPGETGYLHKVFYPSGEANTPVYILGDADTPAAELTATYAPDEQIGWLSPDSMTVPLPLTVETYTADGELLGSTDTTAEWALPQTLKPACGLVIGALTMDSGNALVDYGAPVRGLSYLVVQIDGEGACGSRIELLEPRLDGALLAPDNTITEGSSRRQSSTLIPTTAGTRTVTGRATDSRGQTSDTVTTTVEVLDYTPPVVSRLAVLRCDADGNAADRGGYVKVTYAAKIRDIGGLCINTGTFTLQYKATTETEYTTVELGTGVETGGEYLFAADLDSVYEVRVSAADRHRETVRKTTASTALVLLDINAVGNGMGLGRSAGLQYGLDIGFATRFAGGFVRAELAGGTDLDSLWTPNVYTGDAAALTNCPVETGGVTVTVEGCGTGYHQVLEVFSLTGGRRLERWYDGYTLGGWYETTPAYTAI